MVDQPNALKRARAMRREATAAEKRLWQHLRNRQLGHAKFVRQEPIGPFIADLVCRKAMLVIEIDGETHDTPEQQAYDAKRSAFLRERDYRVIRFRNEDIMGDLGPVLDVIEQYLR